MASESCTGSVETCPVAECALCAVRECPNRDPYHYFHDGCPSCAEDEDQ